MAQYDDFVDIMHDFRPGRPARKMVEYIVHIHQSNALCLGRVFAVFRALSCTSAAAFLQGVLCACICDEYKHLFIGVQKTVQLILNLNSLTELIEWIRDHRRHNHDHTQTIPLDALADHIVYEITVLYIEPASLIQKNAIG